MILAVASTDMANNYTRSETHLEYQVPFCRPFVCVPTFDTNSTGNVTFVLWDCMPDDCKVYVTAFLAVAVMLAVMTISFNCLILGINLASRTRRMRKRNPTMSNYSIYVVSLAVADLLVGIVVLPLCVLHFYLEFMVNELPGLGNSQLTDVEKLMNSDALNLLSRVQSGEAPEKETAAITQVDSVVSFSAQHQIAATTVREVLGVFTHLTLFVSIYTLITASGDRLYAASYSAHFSSSRLTKSSKDQMNTVWIKRLAVAIRRSTVAVFIVWVLGITFALVPLALGDRIYFRHVGHIFAAMASRDQYSTGIRWYLFTLVIPLVGMWVLNLMICYTLWRRKSQLGLKRKRSLRRCDPANKETKPPPSPKLTSHSDSVFEHSAPEGIVVRKYPASKWNQNDGSNYKEILPQPSTPHALYRHKPASESTKTPNSFHSHSFQRDSTGSVLRRKVSSIRRAKEMLKRQSYEASITKTLCIVVVAFTLAVLPLIISLGKITVGIDSSNETLNREVTALSCSLLLLFSNSFVNCVIYGARMRDFRTTLCQLFRTFIDKIKNTFCCCCLELNDTFSSEVVSGVFVVTKHQRAETYQRSPRLGGMNTTSKLRMFSRTSSKKSINEDFTLDKQSISRKEFGKDSTLKTKHLHANMLGTNEKKKN